MEQVAKLTAEQLAVLQSFAGYHGRYWKRALRYRWETGAYWSNDNAAVLQTIRNTLGPSWLQSFRLPS